MREGNFLPIFIKGKKFPLSQRPAKMTREVEDVSGVKEIIEEKIKKQMVISAQINPHSNLYFDLGLDSLSFAVLLTEIEGEFSVIFDITEMEACLKVGELIKIVENKIEDKGAKDDSALFVKQR